MTIHVEIFCAPGCKRCTQAKHVLKKTIEAVNADRIQWRAIDVVEEIDYAVALGVLSTPAIAIDGALVFTALPKPQKLQKILMDYLRDKSA